MANKQAAKSEQKPVKHRVQVATTRALLKSTYEILRPNWKIILKLAGVHAALYLVFVQLSSNVDADELQKSFTESFKGVGKSLALSAVAGSVIGEGLRVGNDVASVYNSIITLLMSLAYVFSLRLLWAKKQVTLKAAFYLSTYPLVPFILVFSLLSLQLLPIALIAGGAMQLFVNGLIVGPLESAAAIVAVLAALAFSGYFMVSTFVALYSVTLPDMTPLKALSGAREVVRWRRWLIFSRILTFILMAAVVTFALLIGIILVADAAAVALAAILLVVGLPIMHAYFYSLYRSLI